MTSRNFGKFRTPPLPHRHVFITEALVASLQNPRPPSPLKP